MIMFATLKTQNIHITMKALYNFLFMVMLTLPLTLFSQNFYNGKEILADTDQFYIDPETGINYSKSPNLSTNKRESPTLVNTDTLFLTFFRNTSSFALYSDSCSKSSSSFTWTVPFTQGYWVVDPGTYILCALYMIHDPIDDSIQHHMIVYENVVVNGTTHFMVDSNAFNRIQMNGVDHNGTPIYELPGLASDHVTVFIPVQQGFCFFGNEFYHSKQYYISSVSPAIKILTGCSYREVFNDHLIYLVENPMMHGIDSSITMTNNPAAFTQSNFHIPFSNINKSDVDFGILTGVKWKFPSNGLPYYLLGGVMYNLGAVEQWSGMIYTDMVLDTLAGFGFRTLYGLEAQQSLIYKLNTDIFDEINDSVGFLETLKPFPGAITVSQEDTINVGFGCRYYASWWNNNRLVPMTIKGDNWAIGIMRELYYPKENDQYYTLFDPSGSVVISGNGPDIPWMSGGPGVYTAFIIDSSYTRGGYSGTYSAEFKFDLTRYNPNPPEIKMIRTTDENRVNVWNIQSGDPLFVHFNAGGYRHYEINGDYQEEYIPLIDDSTKMFVRDYYSTEWMEVPVVKLGEDSYMGSSYKADLSGHTNIDSTALCLKITVVDQYLNRNTSIINPAVIIGDVLTGISDPGVGYNELIIRCYPNPFNETMNVTITSIDAISPVVYLYDFQGKLIQTLTNYSQTERMIKFIWNGRDLFGNTVPTGVYMYDIIIGDKRYAGRVIKAE